MEYGNADNGHFVVEVLVYRYVVMIFEVNKWNWEELGGFRGSNAPHRWSPFFRIREV